MAFLAAIDWETVLTTVAIVVVVCCPANVMTGLERKNRRLRRLESVAGG